MRTIVAGSRTIDDYNLVARAIEESGFEITTLISGTAKGVDLWGEFYATCEEIPIERFPADWKAHGKAAGFIRNAQMADAADALIAVTTGSPGTKNMIAVAKERGLKVFVKHV